MKFDIAKKSFELSESFVNKYKGRQPNWTGLGYFTYKRTYARSVDNRTEEYWETCRRVVEGTFSIQKNHCETNLLPWDNVKAVRTAKKMYELLWEFKWTPPGRGLWIMGTDYVAQKGSACLQNCGFVTTGDIDTKPTKWAEFIMDMSMVGIGVGFDVRGAGIRNVVKPSKDGLMSEKKIDELYQVFEINKIMDGKFDKDKYSFILRDTREGWVASLRILLLSYFCGYPLPKFDVSKVRGAGEKIKGFGGLASGPAPLVEMHKSIESVLKNRVGESLTSADIVDIGNLIGKCVVAGNVRRSSEIVFGDPNDKEFALLKQDKEKLLSHRWNSNNSIFAELGMDYSWHADQTAKNGEPGYEWLENAQAYGRMKDAPDWKDREALGGNPCLEQTLHNFELCCLVETFPAKHESLDEYLETLKIAYLYAKTVTLVPTHFPQTNAVMTKNRRIGLSQSGIMRAFSKHGRREMLRWCDKGYDFVLSLDIQYSNWMGIPRSIKMTSVKPSGTVSILANEPPGIHYPHSEYYIRRIRVGIHSSLWEAARDAGYHVEPEVGQEERTMVVSFPVREKNFKKGKSDVTLWEQVANAVAYQKYWADNQVSCTITFQEHEAKDIKHVLELYEDSLKGISFLPISNHGYVQAPYETITKKEYESMSKDLKEIDFSEVKAVEEMPKFCDGDACIL